MRSAASDGAFSGNGARRKEKEGAGDRTEVMAWEPEPASRPGGVWRPAAARPMPAYGRHVAGAGWSEAGSARAGERGGGAGRAAQLGRKGGGSAQQRLSLFFFEFLFSKSFLNSFGPIYNHFHLLLPKTMLFQNKNSTTLF